MTENKNYYYLRTGQAVELIKEIDEGNFLVYSLDEVHDYYNDEPSVERGEKIIVDRLFKHPPEELLHEKIKILKAEVAKIASERNNLEVEVREQKSQVNNLKKQKTDLSKMIIDKKQFREAKTMHVFPQGAIAPVLVEKPHRIQIQYNIDLYENKQKAWATSIHEDGYKGLSHYLGENETLGIIFDKTEEEVIEYAKNRAKNMKNIDDHKLIITPDKYLTEELISKKKDIKKSRNQKKIEQKRNEVERLHKELKNLEEEL